MKCMRIRERITRALEDVVEEMSLEEAKVELEASSRRESW